MRNRWWTIGLICTLGCGGADEDGGAQADQNDSPPAVDASPGALPEASPDQDSAGAPAPAVDSVRVDTAAATVPEAEPADTSSVAESSEGDPARDALERASRAYEELRSLRADFTMQLENPLLRRTINSSGTLWQRSPDRILLRFTEPEGDVIVGDGRYFWVYYPSVNPDQVTRAPASQGSSGGVDLRAQFLGDPTERFEYTLVGTESVQGRPAHILTLVPKGEAGYTSLKVWIDDGDGLARRFAITEHSGATRTFSLTSLERNPALPDDLFQFTPPPGVHVVEPPRSMDASASGLASASCRRVRITRSNRLTN
jgi:outer membrane lipoprotein carrier protein